MSDAEFLLRLREHEARLASYAQHRPRLLRFVEQRRRADPVPDPAKLSTAERAQLNILRFKMRAFVRSGQDAAFLSTGCKWVDRVPIVLTSRVGLRAATEVFASTPAVILQQSEWNDFLAESDPGSAPFQRPWHVQRWWYLREHTPVRARSDPDDLRQRFAIPDHEQLWFLDIGSRSVGGMNETYSVFRWDGQTATFVDLYGSLDASFS